MAAILIKVLKKGLNGVAMIAALLLFTVLVLTGTEWGSAWTIRQAILMVNEGSDSTITVREINGTLLNEFSFRELLVAGEPGRLRVFADRVTVVLNPLALFNNQLDIRNLSIADLVVNLATDDDSNEPVQDLQTTLSELFVLPFSIRLRTFQVEEISVNPVVPFNISSITGDVLHDSNTLLVNLNAQQEDLGAISANFRLWPESFDLAADINWQAVVAGYESDGELTLGGNLEAVEIFHTLVSPTNVISEGVVSTGLFSGKTPEFSLRHEIAGLQGQDFNMPLIETFSGVLGTQGNAEQVDVLLSADLIMEHIGTMTSGIQMTLNGADLSIATIDLVSDLFTFSGRGEATMGDAPALDLEWELSDVVDGDLLSAVDFVEGNAGGRLVVVSQDESLNTTLNIESMDGTLNGNLLTGSGNIVLNDSDVRDISLLLESGGNSLFLEGSVKIGKQAIQRCCQSDWSCTG